MNRKERRREKKALPKWERGLNPEERRKKLYQNGITVENIAEEWNKGYKEGNYEGYLKGCEDSLYRFFACSCIALNELHGFGSKRCKDFLHLVYEKVLFTMDNQEALQEVYDKIGLELDFTKDDPLLEVQK